MSAGPSRGGRGGGRGGRGGGRGGFTRGGASALPMGALTWDDVAEMDKAMPNRHAYPPIEEKVELSKPREGEMRAVRFQLDFVQAQRRTPWWPRQVDAVAQPSAGTGVNGIANDNLVASGSTAVAGIKRSSAHLPRYSDKFRRLAANGNEADASGASKLASLSLQGNNGALLAMLQREAFPIGLWRMYVEGETRRQERREEAANKRKRKRPDWQRIVEGVELAGNEAASDAALSDDDAIEEADQDEYEDDVEDDYADNYFDNGEEEDVPDEGGAGEADDMYD